MADLSTPVADGTVIGDVIGGKLHGFNLIKDTTGADVIGSAGSSPATGTLLGWLKAIRDALTGNLTVTGSFFQATQPVSATALPLPAGASTEATLAAVSGKLPTLGAKAASGSVSVVPNSDGFTVTIGNTSLAITATSLPLPAGAATSAAQGTANTSLTAISGSVADAAPASSAFAITPSDSTVIATRAIYVGSPGTIVATIGGTDVTFAAVPAGALLPIKATKVKAASTATSIVGLA